MRRREQKRKSWAWDWWQAVESLSCVLCMSARRDNKKDTPCSSSSQKTEKLTCIEDKLVCNARMGNTTLSGSARGMSLWLNWLSAGLPLGWAPVRCRGSVTFHMWMNFSGGFSHAVWCLEGTLWHHVNFYVTLWDVESRGKRKSWPSDATHDEKQHVTSSQCHSASVNQPEKASS